MCVCSNLQNACDNHALMMQRPTPAAISDVTWPPRKLSMGSAWGAHWRASPFVAAMAGLVLAGLAVEGEAAWERIKLLHAA